MRFVLVGNPEIIAECKGFEDTRSWTFYDSIEAAKAYLAQPITGTPQLANA